MQGVKNKMAQAKEASAASLGKMNSQLSQSMQATGAMSAFGATKNAGLKFKPKVKKGQEDEPVVEYKPSKYVVSAKTCCGCFHSQCSARRTLTCNAGRRETLLHMAPLRNAPTGRRLLPSAD